MRQNCSDDVPHKAEPGEKGAWTGMWTLLKQICSDDVLHQAEAGEKGAETDGGGA